MIKNMKLSFLSFSQSNTTLYLYQCPIFNSLFLVKVAFIDFIFMVPNKSFQIILSSVSQTFLVIGTILVTIDLKRMGRRGE
jgi:hypothetical protein